MKFLDLDYVCPVRCLVSSILVTLLITIAVLQEDVRHCLRLSHPASQVEVRRQRPNHLQATDPAVAPIVDLGTRGWCCSAADQPGQVLGVQQGMATLLTSFLTLDHDAPPCSLNARTPRTHNICKHHQIMRYSPSPVLIGIAPPGPIR